MPSHGHGIRDKAAGAVGSGDVCRLVVAPFRKSDTKKGTALAGQALPGGKLKKRPFTGMRQEQKPRKERGKLVIISGPSGVGKSTITRAVMERLPEAYLSVSLTTRPAAAGEQSGREYWFVSKDEFRRRIEEGSLLEYAEVFGNLYGTPRDKMEEALNDGKTVVLEIDVQGAKQVKAAYRQAVMIFILPPSPRILSERMNRRARDSEPVAARRLQGAGNEIALAWQYYDNMVVNDDLEQAITEVMEIIRHAPAIEEDTDENQDLVGED
jgi:guanylate kinase